jgi:hypothetical protein
MKSRRMHFFTDGFALIWPSSGRGGAAPGPPLYYSSHLEEIVAARTEDLPAQPGALRAGRERSQRRALGLGSRPRYGLLLPALEAGARASRGEVGTPQEWMGRVPPGGSGRPRGPYQESTCGRSGAPSADTGCAMPTAPTRMLARGCGVRDHRGRPTGLAGSQDRRGTKRKKMEDSSSISRSTIP